MTQAEDINKRYEIGVKILAELFKLTDNEIKEKLTSICGDKINTRNDGLLKPRVNNGGSVKRMVENEKPERIEIWFYDAIFINHFGIQYKPEHGPGEDLVEFTEHFKL